MTNSQADNLFPPDCFGRYVLKRDRVVSLVKDTVAKQRAQNAAPASVYLSGCRGSGKTSLQFLLANEFEADGYEVYYFDSASNIPQGANKAFQQALLADKTKKVAVLVDEVAANPESGLFVPLLKGPFPNVVTIGSAVPRFISTGRTIMFREVVGMDDLCLRADDEDFQGLVQYCVGLNATSAELTKGICEYVLEDCGGHAYPTLSFIEHFFASGTAVKHLSSWDAFLKYYGFEEFTQSECYKSVRKRCFGHQLDQDLLNAAMRVMGGKEEGMDVGILTRLGWWDYQKNAFISPFLKNACLNSNLTPLTSNLSSPS